MKRILIAFVIMFGVSTGVARAANNCTGATYYDADLDTCIACPAGYDYNTTAGKTSVTQCQIHCDGGTWNGEYTQLEYIESTGTQYIDTGVIPTINTKARVKFSPTARNAAGFFGARKDPYRFNATTFSGGTQLGLGMTNNNWPTNRTSFQLNSVYDCTMSNGYVKVNNAEYTETPVTAANWSSSVGTFKLASLEFDGEVLYSEGRNRAKWYIVQLWEDNVLIRDMVPVRRNSDGAIGMYDKVTKRFFANAGTGTFVAGADVGAMLCTNVGVGYYAAAGTVNFGSLGTRTACPAGTYSDIPNAAACKACPAGTYSDIPNAAACKACPAEYDYNTTTGKTDVSQCQIHCEAGTWNGGYTQLGYIESTGTQYIDTGVIPTINTKARVKFSPTARNSYGFFGARTDPYRFNATTFSDGTQLGLGMTNNNWPTNRTSFQLNSVYDCTMSNGYVKVNNTEYTETPVTAANWSSSVGTFKLASLKANGEVGYNDGYNNRAKWYIVQLWEDNVLIRDMVPVRRNSDGAIGMYDKVTKRFFANAGTGTFVAGADVGAMLCTNVGAGYYAAAATVNFGSVGTRNACPVGLTTVGYGHGADAANDCGRTLHIGDSVVYMRQNKETTPSLNFEMANGDRFYISLSPTNHSASSMHFWYNGAKYTAYDDSLINGERNF